jgi:cell division transport system permease protein
VSVFTLAAAFLSFAATVAAAANLDHLLSRWLGSAEITVYLSNDVGQERMGLLASAVSDISGVAAVQTRTGQQAREELAMGLGDQGDMARTLPETAFPASLDISLTQGAARDQKLRHELAQRLRRLDMVSSVETYDDWFERLSALTLVGRMAAWGLGLVALAVAILVVAAVIRAGVVSRAKEIEVLRLVGATERYVRMPFLLEGTLQGLIAMTLALLLLQGLTGYVERLTGEVLPLLGSGSLVRLSAIACLTLLLGSCAAGFIGALVSVGALRRA